MAHRLQRTQQLGCFIVTQAVDLVVGQVALRDRLGNLLCLVDGLADRAVQTVSGTKISSSRPVRPVISSIP